MIFFPDIRGEDGGKYGCLSIDDDEYVAYVQVEVEGKQLCIKIKKMSHVICR